jgi:hypothetical protein
VALCSPDGPLSLIIHTSTLLVYFTWLNGATRVAYVCPIVWGHISYMCTLVICAFDMVLYDLFLPYFFVVCFYCNDRWLKLWIVSSDDVSEPYNMYKHKSCISHYAHSHHTTSVSVIGEQKFAGGNHFGCAGGRVFPIVWPFSKFCKYVNIRMTQCRFQNLFLFFNVHNCDIPARRTTSG